MAENCAATVIAGKSNALLPGSETSAASWCVMIIISKATEPFSIWPASLLRSDTYETASNKPTQQKEDPLQWFKDRIEVSEMRLDEPVTHAQCQFFFNETVS